MVVATRLELQLNTSNAETLKEIAIEEKAFPI